MTKQILEAIANLIDQAEQGEIDPWDVQVIEVIDRYLNHLITSMSATQAAMEAELSQSGQAFLSASLLVLFKANTLSRLPAAEDDLEYEEDLDSQEAGYHPRSTFEQQLRRRPVAMQRTKRQVTLPELIEQLKFIAAQLEANKARVPTPRRLVQPRAKALRAALELAHHENLTEVAGELEQVLNRDQAISREQNWLNLEQLVELWNQMMPKNHADTEVHNDRVSVFWALLLLSAQSKVELHQEEFYQDLQIRRLINVPVSQPV
jgi:segregation and condensation protein A